MRDNSATLPRPDDQADFYAEHGYLVVEDLLSGAELAELEADLVKLARGGYDAPGIKSVSAETGDAETLERILCIHMPHFVSPVVRRFTAHPGITEALGRIVGAHLRPGHWNGGVKCMQSMFFAKPPGKPGQAWHQDECFIPTRDRSLCAAWITIDDATLDNGCLRVIPGSHLAGTLYPSREHSKTEEFDPAPESHGFDERNEIAVEMRAGSVLFFNGYLLHRSRKNSSGRYRRALVNHYMSTQSQLHWCLDEELADGSSHGSDNRSVHVVCGEDPYASLGYKIPANPVYLREYEEHGDAASS
ncbi:MAG: phytanoyl-CoA dioxygenase family protein [Gammaproteobacteria bacterium]|nr:phytanoyl-CoA dioxygenase family protein [Gammaproteobacteria bacterium]